MEIAPNFRANGKPVYWNTRYHEINLEDLSMKIIWITDQFPKENHKYFLYHKIASNFIASNASKRIQEIKSLIDELVQSLDEECGKINAQIRDTELITATTSLEDKKEIYSELIEKLINLSNKIKKNHGED